MNLINSGDSTGFEPMTSAMPVQCSNQLSYEVRSGEQVNLLGSCFPVKGMSYERMLYAVRCWKSNEVMILALAGQLKQLSQWNAGQLNCSQLCDFIAQLVRALHRHRRGHGFESR